MENRPITVNKIESEKIGDALSLFLLRTDMYDNDIPGNKYWKLKYNLEYMKKQGLDHLVTFGGAYSNHIDACAAAGRKFGIKTTGIIRGEELDGSNATLTKAVKEGMDLKFVDRETYRQIKSGEFDMSTIVGKKPHYVLPEGGSNALGAKGCEEILAKSEVTSNYVACPIGTGATFAGLINGSSRDQKLIGFSAVGEGEYLRNDIHKWLRKQRRWELNTDYSFGGFAKMNDELLEFFHWFNESFGIELDCIYTVKMMYGLFDMIQKEKFVEGSTILALHTGGQQGNESMLKRWTKS